MKFWIPVVGGLWNFFLERLVQLNLTWETTFIHNEIPNNFFFFKNHLVVGLFTLLFIFRWEKRSLLFNDREILFFDSLFLDQRFIFLWAQLHSSQLFIFCFSFVRQIKMVDAQAPPSCPFHSLSHSTPYNCFCLEFTCLLFIVISFLTWSPLSQCSRVLSSAEFSISSCFSSIFYFEASSHKWTFDCFCLF